MSGWDYELESRILPWDDALQCELGYVAAFLAMADHMRTHDQSSAQGDDDG